MPRMDRQLPGNDCKMEEEGGGGGAGLLQLR